MLNLWVDLVGRFWQARNRGQFLRVQCSRYLVDRSIWHTECSVSQIPTNVELSCEHHPRLKPGLALPRNGFTEVSQEKLFSLGTLTLQNTAKPTLASYDLTQTKWTSLCDLYADYLTLEAHQITTDATSETLTRLSEVVGVALGVAALDAEFNIEINRIQRYQPGGSGRRVDFEYYAGGQRFFHETKGTIGETTVRGMCNAIGEQKESTLENLHANGTSQSTLPVQVSGLTGSVALYRHIKRPQTASLVTLIDPPPDSQEHTRPASERDELACVLRYYKNFYQGTRPRLTNVKSISAESWLTEVISALSAGFPAPKTSPRNLRINAGAIEPEAPTSPYRGMYFDARFTRRSALRYPTLAEATANMKSPITFVGVSAEVSELIRRCRWDDLLLYRDPRSDGRQASETGREILSSGILSMRVNPESVQIGSAQNFASLRKFWTRKVQGA
jgi:hypothetical protein